MSRNHRFSSIAFVVGVLVVLAGCRGQRITPTPPCDSPCGMPAGMPVGDVTYMAPPPAPMAGGNIAAAAQSDEARFLVRQKIQASRELTRTGQYAEAERLLDEALALDPSNTDAKNELRDVRALLGDRGADVAGMLEEQRTLVKVRVDEQKTAASKYANLGRMELANSRYDASIEAFEQALFIINSSPYEIDWGTLKSEVESGLRSAQRAKDESQRADHRASVERSLDSMAREEEQRLLAEQERLERIMGEAIAAFERDEYQLSAQYAEQILSVQPDNTKARELLLSSNRAYREQVECDYLMKEKQAYREWMDEIALTRIHQDKILKWPSQSFWEKISTVRSKSRPSFGDVDVDPEAEALKAKAKTLTVNLAVDNQPFKDVLKTLQIQTGINIHVDARIASEVGDATVTGLYVTDLSLDTALNLLQGSAGEDVVWTARGAIIVFTKKEFVKKNLVTEIHDVADLTTGLTDFIPPRLQLVGPDDVSDEDNPLFGSEGEEPVLPYGTIDELIELIKGAVEPSAWSEDGADIKASGNSLIVKASKPVQDGVVQFLNELRGFAGIVVTVEARFLEIGDAFLRDVGVDIRGLGDSPVAGNLVNLDDVTNGLEDVASAGYDNALGIQAPAAANPSAGLFYDDGGDGDFRGRTENIFNNSLGSVLSSLGGASFAMTFLDDIQMSLMLRAVEKSADARTLTAPTITVYNTQRANLTVVNQLSYIQDFDVEVAQTSFIADPIVGVIQDGVVLDVRPTVSNDRRYITLELQPTVQDLIEPIPTFATTLASSFSPVIIQLPEVRRQQARTTVRIPDKGSILIGGLKNITTVDRESMTPWFADIPILSFLFSRKGRSDEVSHLMILVKATITDLAEQREQMMGGAGAPSTMAPPPPSPFESLPSRMNSGADCDPCAPRCR